ncbi:beta-galactosidase, partial [Klebsiella pneumoniae]|uniref:beta-galactosidase n=1 Tax=Klebsiella pneumoniae TaxID=573 RepID=UPI001C8F1F9C
WGEEHHTTDPEKAGDELEELLKLGSLNFYMFEGGTNFGFMAGRNNDRKTADAEYAWKPWNLISLSGKNHDAMHDRVTRKLTELGESWRRRTP